MTNTIRFHGRIPFVPVRGLPPGIRRSRLIADKADSSGHVWRKGSEFVALCGGYDNTACADYSDVTFVTTATR